MVLHLSLRFSTGGLLVCFYKMAWTHVLILMSLQACLQDMLKDQV